MIDFALSGKLKLPAMALGEETGSTDRVTKALDIGAVIEAIWQLIESFAVPKAKKKILSTKSHQTTLTVVSC